VSEERGLPFDLKKQDAILGHLLIDGKFFMYARHQIKPEWFADPSAHKVYAAKIKFLTEHQRVPSVEELKQSSDIAYEEAAMRPKLIGKVNAAIAETSNFGLDVLSKELTKWLKSRIFYSNVVKAEKDFNAERYDAAYRTVEEALKEIKAANFDNEREESFLQYDTQFVESQAEISKALTFGIKIMDDILLPHNGGHGSLLPGDTTVLLAATNSGKTTSMITTICANLHQGKHVLFMTHEGRPQDIKEKLWCCFLGVSKPRLFQMMNEPDGRKLLDMAAMFFDRFLTYIPYNKAGLCVEDVEPIIRRKQEELMSRNDGRGYDLLVCDYPAKLYTQKAAGGHLAKRQIDEIVYGYYIQYALEYGFHCLLAQQTNREGARINKGQKEARLLTGEDAHEAFGPIQEATNVITLNRDPVAKARNRAVFYIDKSRSSETGIAVVCKTSFGTATTHSNELGGAWYVGADAPADNIDALLEQYAGSEIPATALI
jgi:hypothetical protein